MIAYPIAVLFQEPEPVMRKIALALTTIFISVVFTLLMFEIGMRFLPVRGGAFLEAVNEEAPYAHFVPGIDADYSVGPAMARPHAHQTNNAGFISPIDYQKSDKPLLAVVGDSYVEALMVPSGDAMQDVLREALGPQRRVYGFGISGSATPQYLIWARHAVEDFGADEVVLVIVSTDFDEALLRYRQRSGFHYLDGDLGACHLTLKRLDHQPSAFRPIVRHSALARYLIFNLSLLERPFFKAIVRALRGGSGPKEGAPETHPALTAESDAISDLANDASSATEALITKHSKCAVDWVLANASSVIGLPKEKIRFVLDGGRATGHDTMNVVPDDFLDTMRRYFVAAAKDQGYPVIDLAPDFRAARAAGKGPFAPPGDSHWNGAAHALAAQRYLEEWGNSALSQ